jgi:DNA-binding transcriptional MerR regulator/effector-binding domain-containing protein
MQNNQMKISEFAKVTGISRKNLIFYDKIGLLSPAMVDEQNNYRYYTYQQIDTVNVITVLREIGMPLKEIKAYLQERSPERLTIMLETQKSIVQDKIRTLVQISDMLDTRIDLTAKGRKADINSIALTECEAVPILLGPELPADGHISEGWYYLVDFYEFCRKNKIILGLPTGAIIAHADLARRNTTRLSHYYYRPLLPSGYPTNASKPSGLYIMGWEYTEYGSSSNLYHRLFSHIEESGLKIYGNAYEEYLLDEIATPDPAQYLLQIAIHVQK